MSQTAFPATDSLRELQAYVWQVNKERGFSAESPSDKMLMLTEEVGELAKALRKTVGMKFTATTRQTDVAEEIADVLFVLLGLSSMVGVDSYDALLAKERQNRERVWR